MNAMKMAALTGSLLLVAATANAGPPITIDDFGVSLIDFETPPIFDFSRTETSSDGSIVSTWNLTHDRLGRIRGTIVDRDAAGGGVVLSTLVHGRCHTADGMTTVTQRLTGRGDLGNGDSMRSSTEVRGEIHGWGAEARMQAHFVVRTCTKLRNPITEKHQTFCNDTAFEREFSYANAGNWHMRLALEHSGSRVIGTGSIATGVATSQPRTEEVAVSGTFVPGGVSVLRLKPKTRGGFGPVVLRATLTEEEDLSLTVFEVHEAKGSLLGQRFDEVLP